MANTFTVKAIGQQLTTDSNLLAIFNKTGSGKKVTIYNVRFVPVQQVALVGVIGLVYLVRITSLTENTGIDLKAIKHDSSYNELSSNILLKRNNPTLTFTSLFRIFCFSSDEAAGGTLTNNTLQLLIGPSTIFNTSFNLKTTKLQGIVCREGEGIALRTGAVSHPAGAAVDIFVTFTVE